MEHGVPFETAVSQLAILCDETIRVATRYSCDAIFMATPGRKGILDTIFRESETQLVLRKTAISVLVSPAMAFHRIGQHDG
jgi:nucleotide-binding universal stress UspA family protein